MQHTPVANPKPYENCAARGEYSILTQRQRSSPERFAVTQGTVQACPSAIGQGDWRAEWYDGLVASGGSYAGIRYATRSITRDTLVDIIFHSIRDWLHHEATLFGRHLLDEEPQVLHSH